ncbi:von Willebrand factor A domain-containing protein 7 [Nematostella vectensis]|uniref:von Willebrand factor A domain-containing protein 7 n=1 Tax=Nematostella vectensis TaxID=45351 RepID=UPI0020777477|nr:von Willebrand factor A domain-containing protein 7 [Nematostella vectensis]
MGLARASVVVAFVVVFFAHSAWPAGLFSSMASVRSDLMAFSRGSTRTVTVTRPELKKVTPVVNPVRPKITSTSDRKLKVFPMVVGPVGPKGSRGRPGGGGGWGWGSRPRPRPPPAPKTKLVYVKQKKTFPSRTTPSNKFLEALNTIERAIAEANAAAKSGVGLHYSAAKLTAIRDKIKLAVDKRGFPVGRALLGKALWLIKHNSTPRRGKRAAQVDASTYMSELKVSMGPAKFDEFMAVHGDVTLMFAIDTTGSMSAEIETAKKIAVDVINYPRNNPVNYILSPFSDPDTGPLIFRDLSQGAKFVDDINKLRAKGGGDCAELAFKGILDALMEGPDWGSPMYVFTDAPPKDATPDNIQSVKAMAEYLGVTINFFTTGMCNQAGSNAISLPSPDRFKEIAEATSGQLLTLKNVSELQQLDALTGSVLGGSNIISAGSNFVNRKKRSPQNGSYRFKVDDSVEQMSVCITTSGTNKNGIELQDPTGITITSGKTSLSKVSVYQVKNPKAGAWTLVVPSIAGHHEYFVKSTSDTNIDFEHYFLFEMTSRKRGKIERAELPLSYSLKGRSIKLVITVAGADKVNRETVTLELINKQGGHVRDVPLRSVDAAGVRYLAIFTPPSTSYKLKLKGSTKTGRDFERVSRNIVEPKSMLLRILDSVTDFTISPGRRTSIMFQMFSAAPSRKTIEVSVIDKKKIGRVSRSTRTITPGRSIFIPISFLAPRGTPVGETITAVVTVTVEGTGERVSQAVQLIVM